VKSLKTMTSYLRAKIFEQFFENYETLLLKKAILHFLKSLRNGVP